MKILPSRTLSCVVPRALLLTLLPAALLAAGCGGPSASADGSGVTLQADTRDAEPSTVLARVNGEEVTLADVTDEIGLRLAEMDFQYRSERHGLVESTLQNLVRDRLIEEAATERGVPPSALVQEITAGKIDVSHEEILAFYEQNHSRLGGRSLDQLYGQIQQFLVDSERNRVLGEWVDEQTDGGDTAILLEPFRVDVATEGHPSTGPEDAPVTLVEFSDFECPYCRSFFPTLERIRSEYGDLVNVVFRQFPLDSIHPRARKAAEASLCAREQGKFWELHDLMYEEQESLSVEDLKDKAERLEMDSEAFGECLDSGRHVEAIDADVEAGIRVGVSGTPALFVNGRPVPGGAVPFETIARVIEDELERTEG